MSKLLKRWLAYLLIPAGLVLLFFPLNTHHSEEIEEDFVFLEISKLLVVESIEKAKTVFPENPTIENVHQYIKEQQEMVSGQYSRAATIINPYGYPIIQEQELIPYPALLEQINEMMRIISHRRQERMRSSRLNDVTIEEWTAFKKAFLGDTDAAAFQYGNRILKGHVKSDHVTIQVEVEKLKISYKTVGAIFLFLSLFTLRGMYAPPSKGIQIGKRREMVLWDIITIGIGIFFTSGFLDSILSEYFHTDPVWGDEKMALFMGVFWIVFANPLMALFTTAIAGQTVKVTGENIAVKGLLGQRVMSWGDVESIELAEFFVPRRVSGILAPRKIAKVLEIRGSSTMLRVLEPPLPSTKKEILTILTAYAPEGLKESISGLSRKWLSIW